MTTGCPTAAPWTGEETVGPDIFYFVLWAPPAYTAVGAAVLQGTGGSSGVAGRGFPTSTA